MRRFVAIAIVLGAVAPSPALAHTAPGTDVFWDDAVACVTICTWYWTDGTFNRCDDPFPPWAYEDVVTEPAPAPPSGKIAVLEVVLDPRVDWDLYLCAHNAARTQLAVGRRHVGEPCDNLAGTNSYMPIGCHEDASTSVIAGQRVIMRAYNVSDAFPAPGRYWFTFV